jgi:hypothetical protein
MEQRNFTRQSLRKDHDWIANLVVQRHSLRNRLGIPVKVREELTHFVGLVVRDQYDRDPLIRQAPRNVAALCEGFDNRCTAVHPVGREQQDMVFAKSEPRTAFASSHLSGF